MGLRSAIAAGLLLLAGSQAAGAAEETLRLGILGSGTVNWEIETIRHHRLDAEQGLVLEVREFAGKQAAAIAFQGGEVDVVVSDLVWVARQRTEGRLVTFAPFSHAVGALLVPAGSDIRTIRGLRDKRIGVAGGPLDKSWLLVRALLRHHYGFDLAETAQPVYGAPPLLQQQYLDGHLDALLTFWHFAAKLEAAGHRRLADMDEVVEGLGGVREVALVGYVFRPEASADAVARFLRATRAAKAILLGDEAEWDRLRPLMAVDDDDAFEALKQRFRAGVPLQFGRAEVLAAQHLYGLLVEAGGPALVGGATSLDEAAFHPAAHF